LRRDLAALFPEAVYIHPREESQWCDRLHALAPEIIVTAWESAPIPVSLPSLRYICHVTGSVRHHIARELVERGVLVTNWGSVAAETVAEGALMMTLAALRRAQFFGDLLHRQGGWMNLPAGTQSLYDRRVGIHGFGQVAQRLLPLLKPFRCEVRAFTTGIPAERYAELGVERSESLADLFTWADVIIEAEALTPASRGMVSEELLRLLRPHCTFVNVGRGGVVNQAALQRLAADGTIRFALDVYDYEPLPSDSPLRGLVANVTLFPHVGGPTDERMPLCGQFALRNLAAYLAGTTPEAVVTTEVYDRAT
jgi:phosphoglycerate dehydrogenase-like enzyme